MHALYAGLLVITAIAGRNNCPSLAGVTKGVNINNATATKKASGKAKARRLMSWALLYWL